jgi:hypothetical protein
LNFDHYKGSEKAHTYFSKTSYIDARNNCIEDVKRVMNDEKLYDTYIGGQKISNDYNNENFQHELVQFIEKRL